MGSYREYRREFRRLKAAALIDRCRTLRPEAESAAHLHAALDELLDTAFASDDVAYEKELVGHAMDLAERIAERLARQPGLALLFRDSFAAAVHYRVPFTTFYLPGLHR